MEDNVTIVHSRNEWKREVSSRGFLKELGRVGVVNKSGNAKPHEVLDQWTLAFFYDDEDQRQVLEIAAATDG